MNHAPPIFYTTLPDTLQCQRQTRKSAQFWREKWQDLNIALMQPSIEVFEKYISTLLHQPTVQATLFFAFFAALH